MAHAKIGQRDKPRKGESKIWIACLWSLVVTGGDGGDGGHWLWSLLL